MHLPVALVASSWRRAKTGTRRRKREGGEGDQGNIGEDNRNGTMAFYYHHPPTLRLHPGPPPSTVKPHHESEYGQQDGDINL